MVINRLLKAKRQSASMGRGAPSHALKSGRRRMATMKSPRHVRIFLSSPADVKEERQLAREMLFRLQRSPMLRGRVTIDVVSWDDPDESPNFLDGLQRQLPTPAECDLTIVVLWARIGTPLPSLTERLSGTEWEFENARQAGRPVLLYRRTTPPLPSSYSRLDDLPDAMEQRRLVEEFFARFRNADGSLNAAYHLYESPAEFEQLLRRDVETLLSQMASGGAEEVQLVDTLLRLEAEGRALTARIRQGNPWMSEAEAETQAREWEGRTAQQLTGHGTLLARFLSDSTTKVERFQPGAPFHISNWGNFLERRRDALIAIAELLSSTGGSTGRSLDFTGTKRNGIFICYRRRDSEAHSGRLFDHLERALPGLSLFIDVDRVGPGDDILDSINTAIECSALMLVVIGPTWLTVSIDDGTRAIDAEDDFVRLEIERAFMRSIKVVPVLVGGASMPKRTQLPSTIADLARRNAVALRHSSWKQDVASLAESVAPFLTSLRGHN